MMAQAPANPATDPIVRHFRHVLLWPLQLEAAGDESVGRKPWRALDDPRWEHPWRRVADEFTDDPAGFHERHYKEFVSFLPYVQRFLYGDPRCADDLPEGPLSAAPMRVFRRTDVKALRITIGQGDTPVLLSVAHVDLYFFLELELVLLNVEVHADDVPFNVALELLYRFGRAYPSGWDDAGRGLHNVHHAEWLDEAGKVLVGSDSDDRDRYLSFVCRNRAPCVGLHWAWLLQPLVSDHVREHGPLRYRQIEYHRMPFMAFVSLDDPRALTRDDFVRLGLVGHMRPGDVLPQRDPTVLEFEHRHCDDRYWADTPAGPNTRFLSSSQSLIVVGEAACNFFKDGERGLLAQFRHQYFLLFLIAHFHRAALLVFSDRLAAAIGGLDIRQPASVRRFKRRIRAIFSLFLGFTHRYWFPEISERGLVQSLFRRASVQLGNDERYTQVRQQVAEMNDYLDSDSARRQSNTVVTIIGLIGTIATGFLGMNLIAAAEEPLAMRILVFTVVTVLATVLTLFAVAKSKGLSDFLEELSDESLTVRQKIVSFVRAMRR